MFLAILSFLVFLSVVGFVFYASGWILYVFSSRRTPILDQKQRKYAHIITAFKHLEMVGPLVESLLLQNQNPSHIYVVADMCSPEEAQTLRNTFGIQVLVPDTPLKSKASSLALAMEAIQHEEYVIIYDPDNVVHPQFMSAVNTMAQMGYVAIQGQRIAKNLDTQVAGMDALGEIYYNFHSREVPFAIGSSATIAGSGMAIKTKIYKEYLASMQKNKQEGKVIIAEDKILQMYLVRKNHTIAYAPNAIVFDEKVSKQDQLERQRTRWINTWIQMWPQVLPLIFHGRWNSFWFGMMNIFPPLSFQTLFAGVLLLLTFSYFPVLFALEVGSIVVFILCFVLTIWMSHAPVHVWKSISYIPRFILGQVKSLFQVKKSEKDFLATEHSKIVSLDQLISSSTLSSK